MTIGRLFKITIGSSMAGLIIGIIFSGDELVSAEAWVGATAVLVVLVTMGDLIVAARPEPTRMSLAWALAPEDPPPRQPQDVRNMHSLVVSSQSNSKMYIRRLRPHLIDLATHFLPRRHGLDINDDRVIALMGEVYWLINPSVTDRAPSSEELHSFLTIVVDDERSLTEADGARAK